ncbi:hypothetical protein HMPREF1573_00218 [Gardnerella vaginalis JCP7276]|uniref:Uncharacterized protein n=1 Tax=Gardnerella vaginalis JCP8108 TaxID=1261066 RepID=S4GIC9_GARVA|nr:hypothetical protein HMPREF1581_00476 [Gardnerella vaginalis JCP8108]EPI52717.1 hypothetical protein HMPREF1575_00645 [Gardnerella vaginalis JCP7672]EPI57452.1 hypothetical protein HMPREF1573_00218 [Gardnerella vaginalis JCP7276]
MKVFTIVPFLYCVSSFISSWFIGDMLLIIRGLPESPRWRVGKAL